MSAMIPFKSGNLPAHIAARAANAPSNTDLTQGASGGFPVLSIKGKVWTVVRGKDNREVVLNDDGDPRSSIELVILKANPNISKVFYAETFSEGSDAAPTCYSHDGIAPAPDATEPQSKKCATCPRAVWGSKITDNGKKAKECSDSRRVAVAAPDALNDPMLLRVPAASLKPLAEFGTLLGKKGVSYNLVTTKVGFEPETASPKLTFRPMAYLTEEQVAEMEAARDSDAVTQILGMSPFPTADEEGFDDHDKAAAPAKKSKAKPAPADDDEDDEPAPAPAKKAKAKPAPVEVDDDDEDDDDVVPPPVKKSKPTPPPAKKSKAKPAPVVVEDDDDDDEDDEDDTPPPPVKNSKAKAAPVVVDDDDDDDDDDSLGADIAAALKAASVE